jgi:outer membrane lipoprotein-sorting protein
MFKRRFSAMGPVASLMLFAAAASGAPSAPSAREILDGVRARQAQQHVALRGQLRQEATVVPFELVEDGPVVRYTFSDPPETLQLQIGESESRLELVTRSGAEKVTPAGFDQKVRGTDVTYEDLALKFLYWPNAQVIGTDDIRTRTCWKLQVRAPNQRSQYGTIIVWVDKNGGALMRMEGYNRAGQLIRRFEVVAAQKIENRWFLKRMRIEQFQPGTNHVQSRTYLEIKDR